MHPFTHLIRYSNCITALHPAHVQSFCSQGIHISTFFFFLASSCFAAPRAYQEAVRLESNPNRIKFTVAGSVILIIINPSTIVIHYASAMSDLEKITCWFSSEPSGHLIIAVHLDSLNLCQSLTCALCRLHCFETEAQELCRLTSLGNCW